MKDNIPRDLILNSYTYSFKDKLKNRIYTYRCKHRTTCKVIIKIDKYNLKNYNNNLWDTNKYTFVNNIKEHTRQKFNNENKVIEINKDNNNHYKELAKSLILVNINKLLSCHIDNLKKNNINLTNIQIKNLLLKIKENEYTSDEKFLNDITKITISFGNNIELLNLPICFEYNENFILKKF